MRLPWPFGRSASGGGASSGAGAGTKPSPAAAPSGADAPIRSTGAWRNLPPIQRTAGPPPSVAPATPFLAGVPGHTPLPPIVQPLGHESSVTAPAGIVVAHARPVPSLTSHVPLTGRPVQRRASGDGRADAVDEAWAAEPPPAATAVAADQGTAASGPGSPAAGPDLPPIRTVAPVSAAATVRPSARPLTQSGPASAVPAPTVSRTAAAAGDAPRPIQRSGPPMSLQASRKAAAASTAPDESPSRASTGPVRRFAELPAPSVGSDAGTRPRRAGLGSPMTVPPASAVAQRQASGPNIPPALASALAGAPSSAATSTTSPAHDGHGHGAAAATDHAPGPATRPLPVLRVSRQHADRVDDPSPSPAPAAGTGTLPSASTPARAPSGIGRPHPTAASPVLPTLGARPLRPSVATTGPAVQRTASGDGSVGPAEPAPVAARWDTGDGLPDTIASLPATTRSDPSLPVQLSAAGTSGAPPSRASAPQSREIVFPAVGAGPVVAGGERPASRSAEGPSWQAAPSAASRHAPSQPLSLARTVVQAPQAVAPAAPSSASTPVVARIVADPARPSAPPVVQTSPSGSGIPVASFTATPVVQRVEGTAPAPEPAGDATASDEELDQLARQLFGRIRTHLRSEVIHEREAKGLTFDAF